MKRNDDCFSLLLICKSIILQLSGNFSLAIFHSSRSNAFSHYFYGKLAVPNPSQLKSTMILDYKSRPCFACCTRKFFPLLVEATLLTNLKQDMMTGSFSCCNPNSDHYQKNKIISNVQRVEKYNQG